MGRLTETDRAEWANFVRHVAPLRGVRPPLDGAVLPERPEPPRPRPATPAVPVRRAAPFVAIGDQPAGVDSGTWQRFRAGKLGVSRTLDLHGHTAQRAFHTLVSFLRAAHADRVRCVEIVTGRGSGESGGVLRRELPLWLNLPEVRAMILGAAHPHAANPGAVRLLLRRVR